MKISPIFILLALTIGLIGVGCTAPDDVSNQSSVQQQEIPVTEQQQENPTVEEPVEEEVVSINPSVEEKLLPEKEDDSTVMLLEVEENDEEMTQGGIPSRPEPQIRTFDVLAKQWEFVPEVIQVYEGDTVRINVTSTDVDHGLAISAFGVNKTVKAGTTEQIEFVADKQGTFTIFCSVFCGAEHGSMKGTLIVE